MPALVGSALAFRDGKASLLLFFLILLASLLVQVTTNLVDEYSDHARPAGKEKLLAPYKVIALGQLSARAVRLGAVVFFSIATLIGIYLIWISGWPVLVICLTSAAIVYFYSAGPKPLGNLGLGHPLVFLFMGPVMVLGTYYTHTHTFPLEALWLSLAIGCTVTAILAANDLRDLEEDLMGGKTTTTTLLGRRFGRWEWTVLVGAAFILIVALVAARRTGPLALVSLLSLPQAVIAARSIWRGRQRADLTPALRATSKLHLYFGILLAIGLVVPL